MDFGTTITGAVAGIGIGVVIFGARKGWAFLKSLV
jgi:hypothetical protein